jgi:hypothetical protein
LLAIDWTVALEVVSSYAHVEQIARRSNLS